MLIRSVDVRGRFSFPQVQSRVFRLMRMTWKDQLEEAVYVSQGHVPHVFSARLLIEIMLSNIKGYQETNSISDSLY